MLTPSLVVVLHTVEYNLDDEDPFLHFRWVNCPVSSHSVLFLNFLCKDFCSFLIRSFSTRYVEILQLLLFTAHFESLTPLQPMEMRFSPADWLCLYLVSIILIVYSFALGLLVALFKRATFRSRIKYRF